jgi:hypothetical protein
MNLGGPGVVRLALPRARFLDIAGGGMFYRFVEAIGRLRIAQVLTASWKKP